HAGVRAVAFGDTSAVVGSGDTVFALALTNVVSGQVDALRALPTTLTPLACVDTAVVGSPLAFHLDARDGELLLARIEEDAAEPMLELRAAAGVVWEAPITVPMAPPGVLAERLSAFIGDDLVVVARRSAPGEASPALAAFDRLTGSERWTVDVAAVGIDDTQRIDVRALDGGLVVLDVRADTDGRAPATLIALDASDGQLVWRHVVEGDLQDVHVTGEGVVFAVSRDDALDIVTVDASGDMRTDVRVPGASTAVFRADGATWIAATDRGLLAADGTLTTTRHALLDVAITPARAAVAVETDRGPVVAVYRRS
ncbi:MAG: PQQ-binding-like beta-propeller repeat protein, partial [Nitriliruptoraceae bacterium]